MSSPNRPNPTLAAKLLIDLDHQAMSEHDVAEWYAVTIEDATTTLKALERAGFLHSDSTWDMVPYGSALNDDPNSRMYVLNDA